MTLNIREGGWLSSLQRPEVAVTGAVTAQVGRMHLCTGTSADYTVTLPPAASFAGGYIGFRMGTTAALTKLVTLDGNASETIDGLTTRVMWATETCILYSDGSNLFKVAGKTIPMMCGMYMTAAQTPTHDVWTKIVLDTTAIDNTGLMADTTNKRMTCKRTGNYRGSYNVTAGAAVTQPLAGAGGLFEVNTTGAALSGTLHSVIQNFGLSAAVGLYVSCGASDVFQLTVADIIQLDCILSSVNNQPLTVGAPYTSMSLVETLAW